MAAQVLRSPPLSECGPRLGLAKFPHSDNAVYQAESGDGRKYRFPRPLLLVFQAAPISGVLRWERKFTIRPKF